MDPIPDNWPPQPPQVVPLFPLANVWLFPYVILPLHIFELRYRQMIEDILDGTGRIVLGTVERGHEGDMSGAPPIYPIAGLGEVGRHERLEDGRFDVLLLGLKRVRVREVDSDKLYRKVEVLSAEEIPVAPDDEPKLREELRAAILERTSDQSTLIPEVPISHLTDLLTLRMPLPHDVLNELYGELDLSVRAEHALREHASRPIMDDDDEDEADREDDPLA